MNRTTFIAVITVLSVFLGIFILTFCTLLLFRRGTDSLPSKTDPEAAARDQRGIRLVPRRAPLDGWYEGAITDSFAGIDALVSKYIRKWTISKDESAVLGDDSPSRIQDLLFREGSAQDFQGDDGTKLFPNQREYSSDEIYTLLQNESTRPCISHHIFMSILLGAVSLDGSSEASLLPLASSDLRGLRRLREALCGVERRWHCMFHSLSGRFRADSSTYLVSDAVTVHVHDFGAYHACGPESTSSNREIYLKLFESIFEPYLKSVTFEEVFDRRLDLSNVLNAAAEHGMKVIGCPNYEFRYKWGERDVDNIVSYPALWASIYDRGQLVREAELIKGRNDPVVRGTEG